MPYDPEQRRGALREFMRRHGLEPKAWCRAAGLGANSLWPFLSRQPNPTRALKDDTYEALADAASAILGRLVYAAELRGEGPRQRMGFSEQAASFEGDAVARTSLEHEGNEFFAKMGSAISGWAIVEEYLFKICRDALGASTERAAIVYGKTPTIESRRQLVNELLATRISKGHDNDVEWRAIYAEMTALLPIRNRIAHQPMGPQLEWKEINGQPHDTKVWFELMASEHEKARGSKSFAPLDRAALEAHISNVWKLKERIAAFYVNRLPAHAPRLP